MAEIDHPKHQRRSSFTPMRALRSLSISSQVSNSSDSDVSIPFVRRRNTLQKGRPSVGIVYEELDRKPSKSSGGHTDGTSPSTRPASPSGSGSPSTSILSDLVGVVHHGPLQQGTSVLKPKKEYLVLTTASLAKFKNRNVAADSYPQISSGGGTIGSPLSPVDSLQSRDSFISAAETHVPLERVVSVFKDESNRPSFGIEVWWRNIAAHSAFSCLELDFNMPEERDEWLKKLQYAVKLRNKSISEEEVPVDVEVTLRHIIEAKHRHMSNAHIDIFPVIPRQPYSRLRSNSGAENRKGWREGASFYLAFSKNSCLLAKFTKSPTGQKVNPDLVQFGIVTLSRVNASHHDDRFDLIFRLPLDVPTKVQLASRHHRTIMTTLFKADSYLKPSWPHWTRQEVFFVDGEPHQIHLTEGEDFGGFKRSLEAFTEGYHCAPVKWEAKWKNVRYAPEFRLLPPTGQSSYTAHQLLAVFRALRYNDYFKSLSFHNIDFSSLSGAADNGSRLEPTTWLSRTGNRSLTRAEFELVENASVLFQEVVALMIGSESLRHLDLSNVLSRSFQTTGRRNSCTAPLPPTSRDCEVVAPIVLLWKSLQTRCNSVDLSGNHLGIADVSGLSRILQSRPDFLRSLSCSQCHLDGNALSVLWEGLRNQINSVESIDLSHNPGSLEASLVSHTAVEAKRLKRLEMAYVLKGDVTGALFPPWRVAATSEPWRLEELDLSGWKMNFDSAAALSKMITNDGSNLRRLVLKNCGLTGEMALPLFCVAAKDMELIISENPLEFASLDWIDLIYGNEAPKGLHLDMIQFQDEGNFHKLLTALARNKSIEFLSLVGTGPPAKASPKTSELLSAFFECNTTLRFLDLSGYSGKLEDVHLGWGLSGAFAGLEKNTTLRQLRVRNHDMGSPEDVSNICHLLTTNRGLTMFDCQRNNFDHHQFGKLIEALTGNSSLVSFPFSVADRDYAVHEERRVFAHQSSTKSSVASLVGLGKTNSDKRDGALKSMAAHWNLEIEKLADTMQRNREQSLSNPLVDLEGQYLEAWQDPDLSIWLASIPKSGDSAHTPQSSRDRMSMISSLT